MLIPYIENPKIFHMMSNRIPTYPNFSHFLKLILHTFDLKPNVRMFIFPENSKRLPYTKRTLKNSFTPLIVFDRFNNA